MGHRLKNEGIAERQRRASRRRAPSSTHVAGERPRSAAGRQNGPPRGLDETASPRARQRLAWNPAPKLAEACCWWQAEAIVRVTGSAGDTAVPPCMETAEKVP
jgi:hypothetical protein